MKLDLEAYNEIKDRIREGVVHIEQEVQKSPEVHKEVVSYLMKLKSLITEINEGSNGWQIRTMDDKFNE